MRVKKGKIMPVEDQNNQSLSTAEPGQTESADLAEQLDTWPATGRRPNAFGCLLLLTGVLFAILTVLGLRAYARIATVDIWSLAMIAFVGVLAVGQLIVGVWMLRGSAAQSRR